MDEEALLAARLVAGDEHALDEILDRYSPVVYGLSRRITASSSIAEDVLQEVFVELWCHPDRFDPTRGSLRSFLTMQAHRRAVDAVRSESRRTQREERHRSLEEPLRFLDLRTSGQEDDAERAVIAELVREAVNQLPDEQRIVVELAYFGGRTHREIATELGIPEGTAKSRMRLAQTRLRPLLERELLESN